MLQLVWCATIRLAKSVVTGMLVQWKRNFAGCCRSCGTNNSDVGSVDDSNVTFLLSASTSKVAMLHPRMTLALVTPDDNRNDSLFFPSFSSISILILSFAVIFRLVEIRASLLHLESMLGGGMERSNGERTAQRSCSVIGHSVLSSVSRRERLVIE
jgi:hypothetical protein